MKIVLMMPLGGWELQIWYARFAGFNLESRKGFVLLVLWRQVKLLQFVRDFRQPTASKLRT